jgi:hypothetical protein
MWKNFVLDLHGEWAEFAAEYDQSATLTPLCRRPMQRNATT